MRLRNFRSAIEFSYIRFRSAGIARRRAIPMLEPARRGDEHELCIERRSAGDLAAADRRMAVSGVFDAKRCSSSWQDGGAATDRRLRLIAAQRRVPAPERMRSGAAADPSRSRGDSYSLPVPGRPATARLDITKRCSAPGSRNLSVPGCPGTGFDRSHRADSACRGQPSQSAQSRKRRRNRTPTSCVSFPSRRSSGAWSRGCFEIHP